MAFQWWPKTRFSAGIISIIPLKSTEQPWFTLAEDLSLWVHLRMGEGWKKEETQNLKPLKCGPVEKALDLEWSLCNLNKSLPLFSASSFPSVNGNNSVKCFEIFELKALHTCEVLSIANIWKEIGVRRMSSVSLLIHSVSSCKDSIKLCSLPAEYFQSILHSVISICWLWMTVTAVTVL